MLGLAVICGIMVSAPAARRGAKPAAAAYSPTISSAPVTADDLGFDEIIYVKRMQYSSDHYYT
ncbi:MAG: hypothetical protein QGH94_09155, partial [Phycisphaerae bacterium]|nr:hypothetical protein [Phycisphaerae bacterium]